MKVSKEQLEIYQSYGGDPDGLSRTGSEHFKEIMKLFPWSQVDEIVQALFLIKNNHATKNFETKTFEAIKLLCDSTETSDYLKSFV